MSIWSAGPCVKESWPLLPSYQWFLVVVEDTTEQPCIKSIDLWVTCSLDIHTCDKCVTSWVNCINYRHVHQYDQGAIKHTHPLQVLRFMALLTAMQSLYLTRLVSWIDFYFFCFFSCYNFSFHHKIVFSCSCWIWRPS